MGTPFQRFWAVRIKKHVSEKKLYFYEPEAP